MCVVCAILISSRVVEKGRTLNERVSFVVLINFVLIVEEIVVFCLILCVMKYDDLPYGIIVFFFSDTVKIYLPIK